MDQVYNLGATPPGNGLVAQQFSLIQQAQTAGISMIMICVDSLNKVYGHYTTALQAIQNNMASSLSDVSGEATTGAVFSAIGSIIPGFSMVSAITNQQIQTQILATMLYSIMSITNLSMSLMWLPIVMFVLTSLFTAGVQFALIVPLTPYILFWAGQIAWLLGVLEALIAAPIVMLGIAHPGGHDYMGHSSPAVKMLLSIVFRPVLMVIGMVTGILLTYVVINFSAQGFHTVAASILNMIPNSNVLAQGIMSCFMLFLYCSFIVLAFNKCFSAIYVIPDKVMEWVGVQRQERAGAEDIQQLSSQSSQSAQQGISSGGEAVKSGIQAKQQQTEQMGQYDQKQAQVTEDVDSQYAQQTGQSVQTAEKYISGGSSGAS
jgi:hypothetical protein